MRLAYQKFENFILRILIKSGYFKEIQVNCRINNREVDMLATKNAGELSEIFYIIEIKTFSRSINVSIIEQVYAKWLDVKISFPISVPVIVTLGPLTRAAMIKAKELKVEYWDINVLRTFVAEDVFKEYYQEFIEDYKFSSSGLLKIDKEINTKEDIFIKNLSSISAGKKLWSKYQQTVYDILEHLFCPPLESPKYELADRDARNRRDIIFENTANKGFWKSIKEDYKGDFIVIDAKNYNNALSKRPILDISHYLKPYGCGMFSLIITRKSLNISGEHARKEQWIGNKKIIIILSDIDLIEMLEEKKKNDIPEEIIRRKIADFRMSL